MPPLPYFAPDEIEAASVVLLSGKVNYWPGEEGRYCEREYAAYVGTKYALALAKHGGASYKGLTVGSIGDIGVFSFWLTKNF